MPLVPKQKSDKSSRKSKHDNQSSSSSNEVSVVINSVFLASFESIKGFSSESIEVKKSSDEDKSKESSKGFIGQIFWSLDEQERKKIGEAYISGTSHQ